MTDILEALVARAVAGGDDGADAIGALYDELNDTVYHWVRFYIRDGHVAEDLCQEVWLKVAQNISKYRAGTCLLAWLRTITKNTALDYLRSVQRRPSEVLYADHLELDRPRFDQNPEEHAERRALAQAVAYHLQKLRHEQRQVLILRFFDGLTPGQTAQIMGKSDGAVRTLTVRALRKLAAVMPAGESSSELVEELLSAAAGGHRVVGTRVDAREARVHVATR
ncbi:sigma-70 family RNA polymerase sigma factor [Streptomyces ferrugineus]|uniref:Sigma-70 family RNA polymerase sigma factor n=1 Tax=Streptomyces ferrugineus TaxID=1413221 RepID=A0A7M2SUU1_9ACTN|nr:sigma-70 family RNA polymerase sigma factor [Streptomyces ferrugineus]QOV40126.1 sigma-70 family RNA polymerase sigma factor [Streptomyces ferrugineus]